MKKTIFAGWSVVAMLTPLFCPAQQEPALIRVVYDFIHINDTLQPEKPHREEMVLHIGRQTALYGSYVSERLNQQIRKQMEDPAFDGNLTITGRGQSTPESYYTNVPQRMFKLVYTLAAEQYLIDEPYPSIDWRVTDKVKDIGGYPAQQAMGRFGGRDYTAWFTTAIPVQGGPWKLLGLPGLVLEAADSRGEVVFRYAGLETLTGKDVMVGLPEQGIPTNRKALDRLVEAYRKNPQAAMRARSQGGGTPRNADPLSAIDHSRIKSINVKKDHSQTSSVVNNPLELEQEQ